MALEPGTIAETSPAATRMWRMLRAREEAIGLSLALLLALIAAMPLLLAPGFAITRSGGDSPFLLQRVHGLAQSLRSGALPARWMPDAAHGLGYPFYGYYAALPYYVAALLHVLGLGVVASIQWTQVLGFAAAGLGAYRLARRAGAGAAGSVLASAAYTYAPFHLVNVYVRGDSLSEFYAFAFFPFLLEAATATAERPTAQRAAILGAGYALLVLTHNISALLFSPLLLVWLLVMALRRDGKTQAWKRLGMGALGLTLGLALSAWFWLPALHEQPLVQLQHQTTGYFHYAGHFRSGDLVQPRLTHDYTMDAERDPFSTGLVQTLLGGVGLAAVTIAALRRRARRPVLLAAVGALGYTFLMTPLSRPIWDHLPLLPYAQFPWRMLSVQALAVALLAGEIPAFVRTARAQSLLAGALATLVLIAGMAGIQVDATPLTAGDISSERLMLYETYSGNIGSTVRYEYLPREMVPRPHVGPAQLRLDGSGLLALEGSFSAAQRLSHVPGHERWSVEVTAPGLFAFPVTFMPGWRAEVDGLPRDVQPLDGLGLVGLRLEVGEHQVALAYTGTRTQRLAGGISGVAAAGWLGLLLYPVAIRRRYRLRSLAVSGGVAVALLALVAALWPQIAMAPGEPIAESPADVRSETGPLVMDFARLPYLHAEPGGISFGEARLTDYGYSQAEPTPGQALAVELWWETLAPGAEVRLTLQAATAHLYAPAPVWAEVRAPLDATRQTLLLELPENLPPGLYTPSLAVWRDGAPLSVRSGHGASMGTPSLAPLRVTFVRRADEGEALGHYGPEGLPPVIRLQTVSARAVEPNLLEVALEWSAERQAPLNYALSLRVDAPGGARLASRDLPPLLGAYPTGLWRPGEAVHDRVLLHLTEPPPAEVDVEVVLYHAGTLQAAGTVRVQVDVADEVLSAGGRGG